MKKQMNENFKLLARVKKKILKKSDKGVNLPHPLHAQ